MSSKPQSITDVGGLDQAHALEREGQKQAAYEAFLRLGAFDEAARVLAGLGHFAHASRLLLSHLAVGPRNVGALPKTQRRLALHAAKYAAKAGQTGLAVELFLALGKREQAIHALERAGRLKEAKRIRSGAGLEAISTDVSDSAPPRQTADTVASEQDLQAMHDYVQAGRPAEAMHLARQMGRVETVAELFAEAGMPFQAAKCYQELGVLERSLDYYVRVPRRDAQYRKAVVEAVRLSSDMGKINVQLEQFLTDFIATGPQDDRELEAFYLLGRLYVDNDFNENAQEVFETILAHDSSYRDVVARLSDLLLQGDGRQPELEKVLKEDMAFWETDTGQDLRRDAKNAADSAAVTSSQSSSSRTMPFVVGPHGTVVLPTGGARTGFEVGSIVADRYRIDELLGRGGMAAVFRAHDLELGDEVALKVFSQPIDDEAALARFRQELKLSRLLVHPNIVRLYDIGVYSGFRYITMELLVGRVLEKLLDRPLDLRTGLNYLLQACAALKVAHDKGVVHRDLKPSNLFITREDCLKVMDFGIAKHRAAPGLTAVGMLAGTPEYMSPEQINDFSTVTSATDLYALGVIAYEMFTGRRPFENPGLGALLHMHLKQPPEPPRRRSPDIPEELERIILRLLAKKPEQRYADCGELAIALERIRERLRAADAISGNPPAESNDQ